MKTLTKLLAVAAWLENSDNELLVSAENNEKCLLVVAKAVIEAASILRNAAEEVEEADETEGLTAEKLEDLAALAGVLDNTNDEFLKKQASVLDEILITLSAPKNALAEAKKRENDRIEELKKKYNTVKSENEQEKIADSEKAIKESPISKVYRPLQAPLSSRTCPDHPGAQISRIGEHTWQCSLDKKIYNYETGFKTLKGDMVPGGGVEYQTPVSQEFHVTFDTRDSKLGLK